MPINDTLLENEVDFLCITNNGTEFFYEIITEVSLNDLLNDYDKYYDSHFMASEAETITKAEYNAVSTDSSLVSVHIDKDNNRLTISTDGKQKTFELDLIIQASYEKSLGIIAKLLPLLNTSYIVHNKRKEALWVHRSEMMKKFNKYSVKIFLHTKEVEHIEYMFDMLKSLFEKNSTAYIQAEKSIEENKAEMNETKKDFTLYYEKKMKRCRSKLVKIDRKIMYEKNKTDKAIALSGIIKSFTENDIINFRQQLAENLDRLHSVLIESLRFKIARCTVKISKLNERCIITDAEAEKEILEKKIRKLVKRRENLIKRINKLCKIEVPFVQQSDEIICLVSEQIISYLENTVTSGDLSDLSGIAENMFKKITKCLNKTEKSPGGNANPVKKKELSL